MLKNKFRSSVILLGAIFALGFALYAQYINGYHPCELCMLQRYVYGAVILFSLIAVFRPKTAKPCKKLKPLISLILLVEVAVAVFHVGIEQKWWEGFSTCSSGLAAGQSIEDIRAQVMAAPAARCDEPTWFFLKLSMASWNALYAFGLFLISVIPCRKSS